jgi:hypothetical protein
MVTGFPVEGGKISNAKNHKKCDPIPQFIGEVGGERQRGQLFSRRQIKRVLERIDFR